MGYKYKVSICMMVKNEEKNLDRCLSSLKIFLQNPSAELIIVDTGSDDKTVEIAKRYTSKVYFHKWNDNFSEMRNITISYAKGEWIFIIDGDEYIENPKRAYEIIIEANLKKYNTMQVQIKSFVDTETTENFSMLPQPRIFRNDGEFKYEGFVHNQPIYKLPMVNTDIVLGHYGYITTDKELMEKKFQRTATILKSEIQKNPNNIYYQYQLAVSYSMYGDSKKALEQIRKTYNMIDKKSFENKKKFSYTYGTYARVSFKEELFDETIRICKEGIKLKPEYLDLYFILAITYLKKYKKEEASEYFQEYLKRMNNYENSDISHNPAFIMYSLDTRSRAMSYLNLALYFYDKREYSKAYDNIIEVEKGYFEREKTRLICKILIKLEKYKKIKRYYDNLGDEDLIDVFLITLNEHIGEEQKYRIFNIFKENDDTYGLFSKIMIEESNTEDLVREFLNKYDLNKLPLFYGLIFKYLDGNIRKIFYYFKRINNTVLRKYIGLLIDNHKDFEDLFNDYLLESKNKIRDNDFQSNRVYSIIANVLLIKEIEEAENEKRELKEKYVRLFYLYLDKGFNRLRYIYNIKKIRIMYNTMDISEDKFLMRMYLIEECLERQEFRVAIQYMREALKEFPNMAMILQQYQKTAFKEI